MPSIRPCAPGSVVARMGQEAVDGFLRLYVTPGADHMGMGAPDSVNMLEVLVDWVEKGRLPCDLVQARQEPTAP
jgi:feruloyl esterase